MRTVHVEHCMGTVFSIDVRDDGRWDEAIAEVTGWLHRVDAVFSTYRPDSDVSRLRRGEADLAELDPLVAEVLAECDRLTGETDGYFSTAWAGAVDPTGLVKGWAIERASALLRARGSVNHAINGGGDMQLAGESHPGQPWRVGIADPLDRTRVLTVVTGRDIAVATSGTAERGAHIVVPRSGLPPHLFDPGGPVAVTVVGPALGRVDAYATAAFARGSDALAWLGTLPAHEGLVVAPDGAMRATPGLRHDQPPRPRQPARQLSVGWSPSASSR